MKNIAIGLLILATILFGSLYVCQTRKVNQAQSGAKSLQQDVTELRSNAAEREKQTENLRQQLEEARMEGALKSHEAAQLRAELLDPVTNQTAPSTAKPSGQNNARPSNALAEMFKNPEMKDLLKSQQKTVLGPMIDKNYAKLFADLHLTPDQASTFKEMLLNKQMSAAEMGLSMLADEGNSTNRAALVEQVKTASDAADAQIKEFLGEDNFAKFQDYEKTMGERMAVSGFKDQLGNGLAALTDEQEQQLIQVMTKERENFKFTTDFSDKSRFAGDFTSLFTEDKMNTYFQELDRLDQQYLTRAQTILSPDQLVTFGKYLNNQQGLQKAGMQMAVKMFAPAKPAGN